MNMGSSNKTAKLRLSQFTPTDKPSWQGDYNRDMREIDNSLIEQETAHVSQAQTLNEQITKLTEAQASLTANKAALDALAAKLAADEATLGQLSQAVGAVDTRITGTNTKHDADMAKTAKLAGADFTGYVHAPNLPNSSETCGGKRLHWGRITGTVNADQKIVFDHALGWRPNVILAGVVTGGTVVCTVARAVDEDTVELMFAFVSTGAFCPPGTQLTFSFLFME